MSPAASRRPAVARSSSAVEGQHGEKEEEREGEVGGHERAVRQHVGRERGETNAAAAPPGAEALPRGEEDGDDQARGECHHRQAAQEQQPVGVVPAVQETPAELPLPGLPPTRRPSVRISGPTASSGAAASSLTSGGCSGFSRWSPSAMWV